MRVLKEKIKKILIFLFWKAVVLLLTILKTYQNKNNINVLVIDFQLIGDSVIVSPIFKNIKYNLNNGEVLELLCFERESQVFNRCNYIDKIFTIKRFDDFRKSHNKLPIIIIKFYYWYYLVRFVKKNLVNKYGRVIVPRFDEDTIYSGVIALLTNARERFAYSESVTKNKKIQNCFRDYYFTDVYTHNVECHELDKYIDLLRMIGYKIVDKNIELVYMPLKNHDDITLSFPYVVFCTDTSKEKREWDIDNFLCLAKWISEKGYKVVLLGTKESKQEYFLLNAHNINYVSLIGKTTIEDAIDIIGNSTLYLGLDTGLSHIAAGVNVPGVVVFSNAVTEEKGNPSSVTRFRPKSNKIIVVQPKSPLFPCKTHCVAKKAHCINQVSVDEVKIQIEYMLNNID